MVGRMKKRLIRTFFLCLIGLAVGGLIGAYQIYLEQKTYQTTRSADSGIAGIRIGGPFALTDQDGKTVRSEDFKDRYQLIYFGFTYCPAICPTELQKISRALKAVEADHPDLLDKIAPIFITVDPERDTPAVLKDYLTLFHPRFTGLTGSPADIEQVKKDYRIYAAKVEEPGMTEYSMDHSSFIYFIAPQGNVLGVYRVDDTAETIAADIRKNLI